VRVCACVIRACFVLAFFPTHAPPPTPTPTHMHGHRHKPWDSCVARLVARQEVMVTQSHLQWPGRLISQRRKKITVKNPGSTSRMCCWKSRGCFRSSRSYQRPEGRRSWGTVWCMALLFCTGSQVRSNLGKFTRRNRWSCLTNSEARRLLFGLPGTRYVHDSFQCRFALIFVFTRI
jgi:hypothetical protein